ncbi:COG1470 family protein [Agromyces bauzanensis]
MTAVILPAFSARRRAFCGIRRAFVVALLSCIALVAMIVGDPSTARAADDTIGISGQPANAEGNTDGRTRFSYSADPGQQITDHYLVKNVGTLTKSFTVLATDAFNDDAGAFALLETSAEPKDVGSWVHFEGGANKVQFDLAPGESRLVPFTVDVPAQAGPGDHPGGIVASVFTPGEQVNLDRRLGTRLYLRVSGDIQAAITIASIDSQYVGDWWNPFDGAVRVLYTVKNTGNVALASNVSLGVRTWFSAPASAKQGDGAPELLPGFTRTFETEVPGVASWGYLNPWVTINPFVEGDDAAKALPAPQISRDTVLIAPPWPIVVLAGLVVLYVLFSKGRRLADEKRAAVWIAHTEQEARRKIEAERAATEPAKGGRATDEPEKDAVGAGAAPAGTEP